MSHSDHAPPSPYQVSLVVVSSSRDEGTDHSGPLVVELLEAAGHRLIERRLVTDDREAIRGAVRSLADDAHTQVVVLTGGTGISAQDVTPEALLPLFSRTLPGFGELFRMLSFQEIGAAAMLSRATAGVVGKVPVFAVPGSPKAVRLALEQLILPQLAHVLGELARHASPKPVRPAPEVIAATTVATQDDGTEEVVEILADDGLPAPTGSLGVLGQRRVQAELGDVPDLQPAAGPDDQADESPTSWGWRRAVRELSGEVVHDRREDLPWALEKIAPVTNVLDTSGEQAVLRLPSGLKYSLWGWPDLQRPESKVLAVGWGEPLAEVVALHRYPVRTGLCIDEDRALVLQTSTSVAEVCEEVTGRAPRDTTGTLFAVTGTSVYLQRGRQIIEWNGRKETTAGSPKQALATLMISWSNR